MNIRDVFPGIRSETWPWSLCNVSGPPYEPSTILLDTIERLELRDVDVRVSGGLVAVTARISGEDVRLPFVSARFPSFEFTFHPGASWSSSFRASVGLDGSYSFEIDKLPLTIAIPGDLLAAHPEHEVATKGVTLTPGAGNSTIEATFRLRVQDGNAYLDPHVPISLGPCMLSGIPLLAIHDLRLIATPADAHEHYDWVVKPLDPNHFPFGCGGIAFGGLMVDWDESTNPLREVRSFLTISEKVEWVFEDIVIPAVFLPPLPQHGTFGLRRSLQVGESITEFLTVDHHVIVGKLTDAVSLFLDQLFFRTLPYTHDPLDGLSLEGGISIAYTDDEDEAERGRIGIAIGIIDGDVVRLTFERTAHPTAHTEPWPVVHLEFFDFVDIDVVRLRAGFSASMLANGAEAGDALQLLGDVLVKGRSAGSEGSGHSETSDDSDDSEDSETSDDTASSGSGRSDQAIAIETADGKPFEVALVDLGYDRGKFSFELVKIGARIRLGPFALVISELGLAQADGATYFTMSGGVVVNIDPFTGGLFFKRLRFKSWGSPDAPDWGLDGIGGTLEIEDVVELEFYGFYSTNVLRNGDRTKEHGLVGKLVIHVGSTDYGFTFDLLQGELFPASGGRSVEYFLIQILFQAQIALATAEVRSIRVLLADHMLPDVSDDDREAGELIYYEWLKRTDPTKALPEDRLAAWKPTANAIAFGMGFGVSFVGCGGVCLLQAFGLGFDSDEDAGLVIALEVFLLGSKKPMALGVFEYDFRSGAFVILIAFDIGLDKLISNFPRELKVKLSGKIVFGNQPGLVALGRFEDVDTWIGASVELKVASVLELDMFVAVCFEWLEDVHVAAGFVSRFGLKADLGIVLLEGWSTLEVRLEWMTSGTGDFAALILFDLGLALTLFRFLRLGLALESKLEWLAHSPDYLAFALTVRIETPWFLPDISFTVECVQGDVAPSSRPLIAGPLLSASADGASGTRGLRIARIDGLGADERPRVMSLIEIGEARAAYVGDDVPVPLDAVIAIEFSDTIADMLALGEGSIDSSFGVQVSGDDDAKLEARYELVGIEVRRRPQGSSGPWTTIESITAPSDTKTLRWQWDQTKRVGDGVAPKRLLLNGATPFFVQLDGPAVDESIVHGNPRFPCCGEDPPQVFRFDFSNEIPGPMPSGFVRRVENTHMLVRGGPCVVRKAFASGGEEEQVGGFTLPARSAALWSRTLLQLSSPDELAMVRLHLAVTARDPYVLHVRARDAHGTLVFDYPITVATTSNFGDVVVAPGAAFRTLELVAGPAKQGKTSSPQIPHDLVELDHALILTRDAYDRWERDRDRCRSRSEAPLPPVVNFLPQQEYEVIVRTEIGVRHSTVDWETRSVEERLAFVTAGPPGLNETEAAGGDLRPYVRSAHAGGRGLLYREEPVNVVIGPELKLFGVGAEGEDEHGLRLPAVLTVSTEIETDSSRELATSTFESEEWFAAHRDQLFLGGLLGIPELRMLDVHSDDPRKLRMERILGASTGTCPDDVVWRDLLPSFWALPSFGGSPLWPRSRNYRASLRRRGAPVVRREPFVPADVTAFTAVRGGWSVTDAGLLEPTEVGSVGYFGEADWDHLRIVVTADVAAEGSLGILVLGDPEDPGRGVRLVVTRDRLVAARGRDGATIAEAALTDPPATINLVVETFADQIRCTAGGATLHVSRLGVGPGACALLAGGCSIRALHVRGIELYGFNFKTSRYESFGEHIASFEALEVLELGDEARALADLRDELAHEATAAMQPDAAVAEREHVFQAFSAGLALPLREQVDRLRITEVRQAGACALLLESPEPLDFVEEIDLVLEHLEPASTDGARTPGVSGLPRPVIVPALRPRLRGPAIGSRPLRVTPLALRPTLTPAPTPTIGANKLPPARGSNVPRAISPQLLTGLAGPRISTTPGTPRITRPVRELPGIDVIGRPLRPVEPVPAPTWSALPVTIIQNAPATKALIIATTGTLGPGRHRIRFAITRRWVLTDDPPTPETAYLRDATVELELGRSISE